ncbi:MAG: (2Fe-2S)-binding protein [Planctomycetota bacterium]|jgi:isoquinoline 1-oxidoreductase alpha subunit
MLTLKINGRAHEVGADVDPSTPLLWVLRDTLGMTGTKYGCGIAQCGACTVHVGGIAMRSCSIPVSVVGQQEIVTIEGLSDDGTHPLQRAWADAGVPQCGYCQAGQIMNAAAMLKVVPEPTDDEIDAYMAGNLCRCGTYQRIRAAIKQAAAELSEGGE